MAAGNPWGRIDEQGTVWVRTASGERAVGSWQAGDPDAGLAHFARRYDDLATEVELLERRLASGAADPQHTATQATHLRTGLDTAAVVGDIDSLGARLDAVCEAAKVKLAESRAARAEARAASVTAKEALVAEAESLAESTQWKSAGDRLRTIVDDWKQIRGVDRKTDDALWKRFAAARDAFTRRRGAHFADLDRQRDSAKGRKEEIVTEAEALAESQDWGPTGARMKELMNDWKAAGRAPRESEDQLWQRFRAAQDTFFGARKAVLSERDAGEQANQRAKEALLVEAEALDPSDNLDSAKAALRDIQDRWSQIGRVPREAVRPLEARMRAAENRVRDAVDSEWRRSAARDNPLLTQLRDAVAKAESQLQKAQASGNAGRVDQAEQALAARREWLAEAERSLSTR